MRKIAFFVLIYFICAYANADELRISSKEPLVVTSDQWKATKDNTPGLLFPFGTYRLTPPAGRNARCLISVLDKDKKEFSDPEFLKKILRGDSMPYVSSPAELSKIEIKEAKINGGLGFYANFVDPDLVGKPVMEGSYKTATPIILSLGTNYLIKVSIFCDELHGADYKDALQILESIRIKKE